MTTLAHIRRSTPFEIEQAEDFRLQYGVVLTRVPQAPGICGDYRVMATTNRTRRLEQALGYSLEGRLVEFKNDKTSRKTQRLYIEFEQTNDAWRTRKPSGHVQAVEEGCTLVVASGSEVFVFNKPALERLVEKSLYTRSTSHRKNGNHPNSYTRGEICSLRDARQAACFQYVMA